jgi:5-methyltetrahydropteroyltriglutamate--homocysteine methyltransferase
MSANVENPAAKSASIVWRNAGVDRSMGGEMVTEEGEGPSRRRPTLQSSSPSRHNASGPAGLMLLPTTLVGSYPQPDWLIDRDLLASTMPPRVRMQTLWRVGPEWLEQAQDDATVLAVRDQERAGIDIISDGEMRRESYSNRFATALGGVDIDTPGYVTSRAGHLVPVPRVVGRLERRWPVEVRDVEFLRAATDRPIKITVPGPFTMAQQASNDFYETDAEMALAYAEVLNAEMRDLFAAGADIVQVDEPYMQARPDKAREYGVAALTRALEGLPGATAVHICFGYGMVVKGRPVEGYAFLAELGDTPAQIISVETAQSNLDCSSLEPLRRQAVMLGVLDLSTPEVESPDTVAARIRRALPYVDVSRLVIAPDCGMKYLPRAAAFAKMSAMVEGTRIVRAEIG